VEDKLHDVAEFERAFGVECEHALREFLGTSSFASTVHYFIEHAVSVADSARRPSEFDDALSVLFNPVGAVLLEGRILKRFYHSIGMRFEWNEAMVFKEEVEEASRQFRRRMPEPPAQSREGR
jgi:hypothetical protein